MRLAKEPQAEVRIVHVLALQPLYASEMLDVEPGTTASRTSSSKRASAAGLI